MPATKTHITGVRTVSIPVEDQDAAARFYIDTLGFTELRDNPTPSGGRWIELAPGTDTTNVTLEPAAPDQTRGAMASASPPTTPKQPTPSSKQLAWTPTRSCAGPESQRCSASATQMAMPFRSPKPPNAALPRPGFFNEGQHLLQEESPPVRGSPRVTGPSRRTARRDRVSG